MHRPRLTVVTWNVNSIRKRLDGIDKMTRALAPDLVCLQETKVVNDLFPQQDLESMGYAHQLCHGMKGYNGVALLSRHPLREPVTRNWGGRDDCRHLGATIAAPEPFGPMEVGSLYIPAGGDIPDAERNPKFAHKLDFLEALMTGLSAGSGGLKRLICGDFNVAPLISDVWNHDRMKRVITHTPPERERLTAILEQGGWVDAVRTLMPEPEPAFTWWSYRGRDWSALNKGRRLDHIWVSPNLKAWLLDVEILTEARGWPDPSDHVPVALTLRPPTD